MSTYYCHDCAMINGLLRPPPERDSLTNNIYKLGKFIKHTNPSSSSNYKTTFTGVASETYQEFIVTAVCSGHVQIESPTKWNIVWIGSESIGIALEGGRFLGDRTAVKVVCYSDENKIHAYPISADELKPALCIQCGRIIAC
jgi:hypothetical protein